MSSCFWDLVTCCYKSEFIGVCLSSSWGKPFWMKVENGFAVLLGVTVVTVTPLSPREYPLDILASDRRSLYPHS